MINFLNHKHLPESIEIFEFISQIDFAVADDYFHWKSGGDGDNGEVLLNELDEYFKKKKSIKDYEPTVDAEPVVWHKVTTRPLTEEEKAYYAEMGFEPQEVFDCEMPEDGQEILVSTKWGTDKDICSDDADYGIGLEVRGDWDGVYAWAEMPQYKGEAE